MVGTWKFNINHSYIISTLISFFHQPFMSTLHQPFLSTIHISPSSTIHINHSYQPLDHSYQPFINHSYQPFINPSSTLHINIYQPFISTISNHWWPWFNRYPQPLTRTRLIDSRKVGRRVLRTSRGFADGGGGGAAAGTPWGRTGDTHGITTANSNRCPLVLM